MGKTLARTKALGHSVCHRACVGGSLIADPQIYNAFSVLVDEKFPILLEFFPHVGPSFPIIQYPPPAFPQLSRFSPVQSPRLWARRYGRLWQNWQRSGAGILTSFWV